MLQQKYQISISEEFTFDVFLASLKRNGEFAHPETENVILGKESWCLVDHQDQEQA